MTKIYLQYLKKDVSDEVKHQNVLQVDTIFTDGFCQACPKHLDKSAYSQYLKKEDRTYFSKAGHVCGIYE